VVRDSWLSVYVQSESGSVAQSSESQLSEPLDVGIKSYLAATPCYLILSFYHIYLSLPSNLTLSYHAESVRDTAVCANHLQKKDSKTYRASYTPLTSVLYPLTVGCPAAATVVTGFMEDPMESSSVTRSVVSPDCYFESSAPLEFATQSRVTAKRVLYDL
jgi:hypothetical protein